MCVSVCVCVCVCARVFRVYIHVNTCMAQQLAKTYLKMSDIHVSCSFSTSLSKNDLMLFYLRDAM